MRPERGDLAVKTVVVDPILVGIGEFTTQYRLPILVVGLNRMFTANTKLGL